MNRNALLGRLLRSTLLAGAAAATLTTGVAFAEQGTSHGKSQGSAHRAAAATTALAQHGKSDRQGDASLAHRHGAHGTIASVTGTSFVLTTKHGNLTIITDTNTTYHAREGATATFATLATGLRVNVHGDRPSPTTLLAEGINLRPGKAEKAAKAADAKAEKAADAKVADAKVADAKVAGAVDTKDTKADKAAKRQNAAKADKSARATS